MFPLMLNNLYCSSCRLLALALVEGLVLCEKISLLTVQSFRVSQHKGAIRVRLALQLYAITIVPSYTSRNQFSSTNAIRIV